MLTAENAAAQASLDGFGDAARPFLKWVGGKRQLLSELRRRVPSQFGTYFEPFLGGGALFFALCPPSAVLSDTNERLIRAYSGIRDGLDEVVARLRDMPFSKEFFNELRARQIDVGRDVDVSAWMIYLNKTAYNGLYRVNRRGEFNAPFGRYDNPTICAEENLRGCSQALKSARLRVEDFTAVLQRAVAGDFVYFDPPYLPVSTHSDFTRYTSLPFGFREHERLRDVALALKRRGVHVLLSNSSAPDVFRLYADHFKVETVSANRFVNSDPRKRGAVAETLISSGS